MITHVLWGAKWRSRNVLDGKREHLVTDHTGVRSPPCTPVLFRTRREAREWIEERYGYIRGRPDLMGEHCRIPHGWKVPVAVRVKVTA